MEVALGCSLQLFPFFPPTFSECRVAAGAAVPSSASERRAAVVL